MAADPGIDISMTIDAPPGRVLHAFFDVDALRAWWGAAHAVTTPRTLGPYAIQWPPTEFRDDLLGRLGGVFRGTVMEFTPGQGFFVADGYWLPPDGEPIGPMALDVRTFDVEGRTRVHVTQTGFGDGERWRRYYDVIGVGWQRALDSLKALLEKQAG